LSSISVWCKFFLAAGNEKKDDEDRNDAAHGGSGWNKEI
jgi:hypothetical protein